MSNIHDKYYEEARQTASDWTTRFFRVIPSLTKKERQDFIKRAKNIQIESISYLNNDVQGCPRISDTDKERFSVFSSLHDWFDWGEDEQFVNYRGFTWARAQFSGSSEAAKELYLKETSLSGWTELLFRRFANAHPRIYDRMTSSEREEKKNEYYMKCKAEWDKRSKLEDEQIKENERIDSEEEYYQLSFFNDDEKDRNNEDAESRMVARLEKYHSYLADDRTLPKKGEVPALPILSYSRQYMNNTKISRIISTKNTPIDGDTKRRIAVGIKDNVINLVDIWSDPNIVLSSNQITQFDMAVMDASYTIMSSGMSVLTAEWIARVMSGNPEQNITPQKIGAIRRSIDKLRSVHIRIDCTAEVETRKDIDPDIKSLVYESYLLPLDKIEAVFRSNGKEIIAYPVLKTPALYKYAEMLHQIIEVPKEFLETQDKFSDTDEAILIKRYVIKRVAQIINKNNMKNNKISYLWFDYKAEESDRRRGLYVELGYDTEAKNFQKKKKPLITNIVKGTLESLKEKGIIEDYQEYRQDNSKSMRAPINGYQIITKKEQKNGLNLL